MKTLIIMRHAKAGYGSPDHTRPLSDSGRVQAGNIGGQLNRIVGKIDELFVSDARRTQQTVTELMAGGLQADSVFVEPSLYDAGAHDMISLVEQQATANTVMVVGHEPTVSAVAYELWDHEGQPVFDYGFPTAGTAIFSYPGTWDNLAPGTCVLTQFLTAPRR